MHILLAGIPATGKSTFADWLVDLHAYTRCPTGREPGAAFFSEVEATRARHADVVIDWGFPVAQLPIVGRWVDGGVEPWWFDGDRDAALEVFLGRRGHPATRADWDRQMGDIDEHWQEIQGVFGDRILQVVRPGPTFMSNEERYAVVVPSD